MIKLLSVISAFFLSIFGVSAHAELVILQYHNVDVTTPTSTSISPQTFAAHMQLLKSEGMEVVDLGKAVRALQAGESLPPNAVAITFDDANISIYKHAFPLLKAYGWPFTVFVNTDAVDKRFPNIMSWDQLRELQQNQALIANHTVHHPYLINTPQDIDIQQWWHDEITLAESRLKQEMGISYHLFAYPYGEYTAKLVDWLEKNNYVAFGQHSGAVGQLSHPQVIPRFPASGQYAELDTLTIKLHSLPFPVVLDKFNEPVLSDNPPELHLTIQLNTDLNPDQIHCYAAGEGEIPVSIRKGDQSGTAILTVKQKGSIATGRGRYNCTTPSLSQPHRFYWYSQLWINTDIDNR